MKPRRKDPFLVATFLLMALLLVLAAIDRIPADLSTIGSSPFNPRLENHFQMSFTEFGAPFKHAVDAFPYDFDNDGILDFIIVSLIGPDHKGENYAPILFLRGKGGCQFEEIPVDKLLNISMVHPRHIDFADLNGDGIKDFFIAGHGTDRSPFPGEKSRMILNLGKQGLREAELDQFKDEKNYTFHVALGDIDGDRNVDVFLTSLNNSGPRIFHNQGNGHFRIDSSLLPNDLSQEKAISSLFLDIDLDGDLDLILGRIQGGDFGGPIERDIILLNDGKGRFSRAPPLALPARFKDPSWGTASFAHGDFNNDGFPDLVVVTHDESIREGGVQLLLNQQDGTFKDATERLPPIGAGDDFWIPWVDVGDVNNDGLLDMVFNLRGTSNVDLGGKAFYLLINKGDAHFENHSLHIPLTDNLLATTRFIDCDQDGDLDIFFLSYGFGYYVAKNIHPIPVERP